MSKKVQASSSVGKPCSLPVAAKKPRTVQLPRGPLLDALLHVSADTMPVAKTFKWGNLQIKSSGGDLFGTLQGPSVTLVKTTDPNGLPILHITYYDLNVPNNWKTDDTPSSVPLQLPPPPPAPFITLYFKNISGGVVWTWNVGWAVFTCSPESFTRSNNVTIDLYDVIDSVYLEYGASFWLRCP